MIVTAGQEAGGKIISGYDGGADPFIYMGIGTGTTAEALGQTALVTPSGARVSAAISVTTVTTPNDTVQWIGLFALTAQTAVTEIGIFNALTGGTMLARKVLDPPITAPANSIFLGQYQITASDGGSL